MRCYKSIVLCEQYILWGYGHFNVNNASDAIKHCNIAQVEIVTGYENETCFEIMTAPTRRREGGILFTSFHTDAATGMA